MDYLFIAAIIATAACAVWLAVRYIKNGKKRRSEPESIKVRRNLTDRKIWLLCACIWVAISGSYIYFDNEKIQEIRSGYYDDFNRPETQTVEEHRELLLKQPLVHRKWYALILAIWVMYGTLCIVELVKYKYVYVTANGIYLPDSCISAGKLTYTAEGDTLCFYKGNRKKPFRYTIVEDEEQLKNLLAQHYQKHADAL